MLKQKYISCLVNLDNKEINKGIREIKESYQNKINFEDVLISIRFKKPKKD